MQRKGDDPSMKGDVPAGLRGRMTSTRTTYHGSSARCAARERGRQARGGPNIAGNCAPIDLLENEPRQPANMEDENGKRKERNDEATDARLRGALIDGVDPKRALLELRDGKFWDGESATRKEDGTAPMPDGFYFVELTSDGMRILNDIVYGPYANDVEAEFAAREGYTLTDFNRALAELERKGHIRREVDKHAGLPSGWTVP